MTKSAHFSCDAPIFHSKKLPEEGGVVVGYSAIIHGLGLKAPLPEPVAVVSRQNKKYETAAWKVFPKTYLPADDAERSEMEALYRHLVFALKYEGVHLLVFRFLASHYSVDQLTALVNIEPLGQYSRRIWFLLEWLLGEPLPGKADLNKKSYVPVLDERLQYGIEGVKSPRHLIINNLPGTVGFCPIISKTPKLESYISNNMGELQDNYLKNIRKDISLRASAYLLLKDSRASFTIEGESAESKRASGWGRAIGQAGANELSKAELLHLQQLVIENSRFLAMGFRKKGGFVGEHDRETGEPIPEHISAKWQDVETLLDGLLDTCDLLLKSKMDAVLAAAVISFGFVFIHPFEDGNGRIHRYLIHHILAKKQFSRQGIIFPISSSILNHLANYRKILESFSHAVLPYIEWKETRDHNVQILNETANYYRYFDATAQAEFLYDCVQDTLQNIMPEEITYLTQYDEFKRYLENVFEMPDNKVALLIRFLEQNEGKLSKRAISNEFAGLEEAEIQQIESQYRVVFNKSQYWRY